MKKTSNGDLFVNIVVYLLFRKKIVSITSYGRSWSATSIDQLLEVVRLFTPNFPLSAKRFKIFFYIFIAVNLIIFPDSSPPHAPNAQLQQRGNLKYSDLITLK